MAGYDFSFQIPTRARDQARAWLHFVQDYAELRGMGLEIRHRTSKHPKGINVYVAVDGPLPQMQALAATLRQQVGPYAITHSGRISILEKVLFPFMNANDRGVRQMTDAVFETVRLVSGKRGIVRPTPLSMSVALMRQGAKRRPRKPSERAAGDVVRTVNQWVAGRLANGQAAVLCDQAIENWIKGRLGLPPKPRIDFPPLVRQATQRGLLTGREAMRLRRFHTFRNSVQHRGARASNRRVERMLACAIEVLNAAESRAVLP